MTITCRTVVAGVLAGLLKLGLLIALLAAYAVPASAQVTIGAPGGGGDIQAWARNRHLGQTVTVGATNVLTDFSFWFGAGFIPANTPPNPYDISYRAYVYEWNAATFRATGAALYTSALNNITGDEDSPNVQRMFNTGGLALTPGNMYVLFLSALDTGFGAANVEANILVDQYAGGGFVSVITPENSPRDTTVWTTQQWSTLGVPGGDLRFEANFVSVPEPSTWMLMLTGILGLGFVGWRRREETLA